MKNNIVKLFLAFLLLMNFAIFAQDNGTTTTTDPNPGTNEDESIENPDQQSFIDSIAIWLALGGIIIGGFYFVNKKENKTI